MTNAQLETVSELLFSPDMVFRAPVPREALSNYYYKQKFPFFLTNLQKNTFKIKFVYLV